MKPFDYQKIIKKIQQTYQMKQLHDSRRIPNYKYETLTITEMEPFSIVQYVQFFFLNRNIQGFEVYQFTYIFLLHSSIWGKEIPQALYTIYYPLNLHSLPQCQSPSSAVVISWKSEDRGKATGLHEGHHLATKSRRPGKSVFIILLWKAQCNQYRLPIYLWLTLLNPPKMTF